MKNIKLIITKKITNLNDHFIELFNKISNLKNIKFIITKKIINLNSYFIDQFNKISNLKNIKTSKFIKVSNFNKLLIALISLLFLYLFYLSIPTLYNKGSLQKDLTNKILKEFNINISFSSEITYSILPSPHFIIENVKIFNDKDADLEELSQIKKLKIFVYQDNFFFQNKIRIKKILIEEANILISKKDLIFFENLFNKKFSNKQFIVKNSKIFYRNKKKETVSIFDISKLNLNYNERKLINEIVTKGQIYNIPYKFKWTRDFKIKKKTITDIELEELKLTMKDINSYSNKENYSLNFLNIAGTRLNSEYKVLKDKINFKSDNSKIFKNDLSYNGEMFFNPFELKLSINLKKLDLKQSLILLNLSEQLLKSNLLFNENINANISFNLKEIIKNKLFNSSKIFLNFYNGKINIDNSYLISNKIGKLKLTNTNFERISNGVVFTSTFNLNIVDQDKFYKVFQISKNNRIPLEDIFFELKINFINKNFKITNFRINNLNNKPNDMTQEVIDEYNSNDQNDIKNWIDLKNFTNKIFSNYSG